MFLKQTLEKNRRLAEYIIKAHQKGTILPDSFVIDVDTLLSNAKKVLDEANHLGINLYFMMKQLGRNPYIAHKLIELGYHGAVVVDFREAEIMMNNHIPIGNVGNLVQTPKHMIKSLLTYGVSVCTVFSLDKVKEINECAKSLHVVQDIMLRVIDRDDAMYSGQEAGIYLHELEVFVDACKLLTHVNIVGVTSFPCYLYKEDVQDIVATPNVHTIKEATSILERCGIYISHINAPSATCIKTLHKMVEDKVNEGEPGHGLTATTPAHLYLDLDEQPCVFYLSEISHRLHDTSYCFGGGHYRRSHMKYAWIGRHIDHGLIANVYPPNHESIDYYFRINAHCTISDTVLMAFRFQIFVTRSDVILVEGLHNDQPHIVGRYTSLGSKCE